MADLNWVPDPITGQRRRPRRPLPERTGTVYPHDTAWEAAGLEVPDGLRVGYDEERDAYYLFDVAARFREDRPRVHLDQVRAVKLLLRSGRMGRVEISVATRVSRPTVRDIETGARFWYV